MVTKTELDYITCADCLSGSSGLCTVASNSVDMILCDLPYGRTNNRWDSPIPLDLLWREYLRVAKKNAVIILFGQGQFTARLVSSRPDLHRYNLVWDKVLKSGHLNAKKMPMVQHEDIVVFYAKPPVYNPQMQLGGKNHSIGTSHGTLHDKSGVYRVYNHVESPKDGLKYPSSILRFEKPHSSVCSHSTQKPVALCEYLIHTYTREGAVVLDNCMGSGTTAVACINTGRHYIGFEKDLDIYNAAQVRINNSVKKGLVNGR